MCIRMCMCVCWGGGGGGGGGDYKGTWGVCIHVPASPTLCIYMCEREKMKKGDQSIQ